MLRRSFLILLAVLAFSLPASGEPTKPSDPDKPVLLVGDSLAYMLAPRLWKVAKKDYGKKFYSDAKGGTNAEQWIREHWFLDALRRVKPGYVIISLGVNDHGVPINRKKFPERAKKLVQLAHHHGVKVVFLLPPKLRYPIDAVRRGIRESGADLIHDAEPLGIELINDGIHPSAKGAEAWAKDLGHFLWSQ